MRKAVIILLTFIYSLSAVGACVTIHYCGGEVASVSVFSAEGKKCMCPVKDGQMKKGCCENKTLTFKIKDDQSKLNAFVFNAQKIFDAQLAILPIAEAIRYAVIVEVQSYSAHNPPDPVKQPLYILNQVFRI